MSFEIKKDPSKVILLATGAGWENAPIKSEKTIYALNDYIMVEKYGVMPDFLFIMDILDEKPQVVSNVTNLGEVIQRINKMRIPMIAPYKYEEIPMSQAFPIKEVVQKFGVPYFTNTICYMIAYALLQGAKEIELWGINQAGSHEYTEERGGVEFWIGIALGMGVKITINGKDSQLLLYKGRYGKGTMYGYLLSYDQVVSTEEKFGAPVIRKLLQPKPAHPRSFKMKNEIKS